MKSVRQDQGPLRVYFRDLDPRARSRASTYGVVPVDDPSEAEAVIQASASARPDDPSLPALSARESEILGYLADGWSNEEIADRLRISGATVKFHLAGMYRKFGVSRRGEAVREGLRLGIVEV
jgi:DNA-binding CsgD family transcriptional regulator